MTQGPGQCVSHVSRRVPVCRTTRKPCAPLKLASSRRGLHRLALASPAEFQGCELSYRPCPPPKPLQGNPIPSDPRPFHVTKESLVTPPVCCIYSPVLRIYPDLNRLRVLLGRGNDWKVCAYRGFSRRISRMEHLRPIQFWVRSGWDELQAGFS